MAMLSPLYHALQVFQPNSVAVGAGGESRPRVGGEVDRRQQLGVGVALVALLRPIRFRLLAADDFDGDGGGEDPVVMLPVLMLLLDLAGRGGMGFEMFAFVQRPRGVEFVPAALDSVDEGVDEDGAGPAEGVP